MIKLLEQELLLELIQLRRDITCCTEQSDFQQVIKFERQCQQVLKRIKHFANLSRSTEIIQEVQRLKKSYRLLLEHSIFQSNTSKLSHRMSA